VLITKDALVGAFFTAEKLVFAPEKLVFAPENGFFTYRNQG